MTLLDCLSRPVRVSLCALFFVAAACGDEGSGDSFEGSTGQNASDGDEASESSGGSMGAADAAEGTILATFVWIDGAESEVELEATHEVLSSGTQHACGGSDFDEGVSVAVTWRAETTAGTHAISLLDGPGVMLSWPSADGESIRATLASQGEVTFEALGVDVGEVVSGTASVVLSPDPDDADDRVAEVHDIAFHCVISETL